MGSYGLNMWAEDPAQVPGNIGSDSWYFPYLSQVRKPGNTPIFTDSMWEDIGWPGDTSHSREGVWPQPAVNPNAPSYSEWTSGCLLRVAIYRHDRGVNATFFDGHTQWVAFDGLWGLNWSLGFTTHAGPPWELAF